MIAKRSKKVRVTRWRKLPKWLRVVLVPILAVTALTALIAATLLVDLAARQGGSHGSHVITEESSVSDSTLTLHLQGVTSEQLENTEQLRPVWLQYGDVLLPEYFAEGDNYLNEERFYPDDVLTATRDAVNLAEATGDYDRLVLIGTSMGGRLLYEFVEIYTGNLPIYVILIDVPVSTSDLVTPGAGLLKWMPFGPVWNMADLDPTPYKMSFWRDQIMYIMSDRGVPETDSLAGDIESLTYIICTRDNDVVRASAADAWVAAFPDTEVISVDSVHAGYNFQSEEWQLVFNELFSQIVNDK